MGPRMWFHEDDLGNCSQMISEYKAMLREQQNDHATDSMCAAAKPGEMTVVTATHFGKLRAVDCFSVEEDDCEILRGTPRFHAQLNLKQSNIHLKQLK